MTNRSSTLLIAHYYTQIKNNPRPYQVGTDIPKHIYSVFVVLAVYADINSHVGPIAVESIWQIVTTITAIASAS